MVIVMRKSDFERAKKIEMDITDIKELINQIGVHNSKRVSAYTLVCVNDQHKINLYLGNGFLERMMDDLKDALTLKVLQLEKELNELIDI